MKRIALAGACLGLAVSMVQAEIPALPPGPSTPSRASTPAPTILSSDHGPIGGGCTNCGPLIEFEADYIHWWVKKPTIPFTMVTTGNPNDALAGIIGAPSTTPLFGPGEVGFSAQPGFRLGATAFLDRESGLGVNVGGFFLGRTKDVARFASGPNGLPIISRPALNIRDGQEIDYPVAGPTFNPDPNALIAYAGSYTITNQTSLFGYEVNAVADLGKNPNGFLLRGLAGYRQLGLRESTTLVENIRVLPGGLLTLGGGNNPVNGVYGIDSFDGTTDFYGAQVGARLGYRAGCVGVDVTAKVALGVSQQRMVIDGYTIGTNGQVVPGAIRTATSNIGRYTSTDFAVLPEVGINLIYSITERIAVQGGYNFLYLSRAIRPIEQLDRRVNVGLIPTDQDFGTSPTDPALPGFSRNVSDFWAHGFNLGLTVNF